MQKQPLPKASRHFPAIFIKRGILIASIAFASLLPLTSCSSSKDASRDDKMGNSELMIKKLESDKITKGEKSLKDIVPVKEIKLTEKQKGELVKLRDSLDTRMQEIAESPVMRVGHGEKFDVENFKAMSSEHEICFLSSIIIDDALKEDWAEVRKYKDMLFQRAELIGHTQMANDVMHKFHSITNQ